MGQRGVNKVILVGNLGKDPEVRFTPAGKGIANITIATSEVWKDKNTGEQQERTEWHRVVFFGGLADIVAKYLKKGSKIYVEGKLRTNKWQDQNGNDRYTTEVIVDMEGTMQMLDSRGGGSNTANFGDGASSNNMNQNNNQGSSPQQSAPPPMDNSFDDDIPF